MSPSGKSRSTKKQQFSASAMMDYQFWPTKRDISIDLAIE
jgi:hypothetical protein